MGLIGHIAVYFVIWWTTLFAVLPFGVRSQAEHGEAVEGSDPGAPAKPHLLLKFLVNTLVAGAVWGLYYLAYQQDWFAVRG